jgi:redox-sensitive bicupin YhaK (pirin superfamily)
MDEGRERRDPFGNAQADRRPDARFPALDQPAGNGEDVRSCVSGIFAAGGSDIDDPNTDMQYLDVELGPGAVFARPLADSHAAFVYVYEGSARTGDSELPQHSLAVLGAGDEVEISAGAGGARFICVAGKPIGEDIVQHGPFVMNTRAEIEQAFREYQSGQLVRKKAVMTGG